MLTKEVARDLVRVLAGTVNNLRADNSINAEAKKTLDLTAKFLLDQITAALQAERQAVWEQVKDYQQMRILLADNARHVEVVAGNIVKEAVENGAIAELRGLETWINEQDQP